MRRERRGVGGIIAGVILAAILLTSVLVYFITILNNEKARTSYEIAANQAAQDKSAEKLTVLRDHDLFTNATGSYITTAMRNNGSLPLAISYLELYCVSPSGCPSPNDPKDYPTPTLTLNAAGVDTKLVGPVSNTLIYRVDVITERGNIVSTVECTVDLTAGNCSNDASGGGPPDFSMSAVPSAVVIEAGKSGTSSIVVSSLGGFASAVDISVSGMPSGVTVTPNPCTVTPPAGGSATCNLNINTLASTTAGTYTMTFTGTSGSNIHTTAISLTILTAGGSPPPPDFSMSAVPSSIVLETTKSGTSSVIVSSLNGFSSSVGLSYSISPATSHVTAAFAPTSVIPPSGGSASSDLTVSADGSASPGTYTLTITGTAAGPIVHTTAVSVTVLSGSSCVSCSVTVGIIQGTGSVQLDFKSFGAIYPTLTDRDTVSQKGWHVSASKVNGYPGFTMKQDLPTIIVERMRNFDPSGKDMILDKSTSLVAQLGGTPGNNPTANYICSRSGDNTIAYNGNTQLPYTVPTGDPDLGMQTVYFCSSNQGGTNPWAPTNTFGFINPIFMVLRSTFLNTNLDYGQTVPYQSFLMTPPFGTWHVCLTSTDLKIVNANNCDSPTSSAGSLAYKYKGNPNDQVYIHFNTGSVGGAGTAPYKVEWIYPDGTSRSLTTTTTTENNLRINVPTKMADGTTDITRSTPGNDALYILKVSDSFVSDQGPHTMFMTFKVT